ncbi:MAG: hypothetical protein MUC35_06000 [Candidatus Margulisbacteria bacterium]|jgi:hypothetical protein|nr:hypothetical protein [Candidatus Margulisiibacteriota bacterium]
MESTVENINLNKLGAEIDTLCKEVTDLLALENRSGITPEEIPSGNKGDYAAARKELL